MTFCFLAFENNIAECPPPEVFLLRGASDSTLRWKLFELWLQMNLALLIEQHGNVFDLLNEEVHQRIKEHDDFESVHLFSPRLYNRKKICLWFHSATALKKGTTVNKAQERIMFLTSVYLLKNKYKIKYTLMAWKLHKTQPLKKKKTLQYINLTHMFSNWGPGKWNENEKKNKKTKWQEKNK